MGLSEAGNTRLRSARQALGLRSQQQLADAVTRAGAGIGVRVALNTRAYDIHPGILGRSETGGRGP